MKKETKKYLNEICDNIEVMLSEANDVDRWEAARQICEFAASFGSGDLKDANGKFDMFMPIKLLKEASDHLVDTIDKEFLDIIGKECVKEAKKQGKLNKDKTAS